MATFCPQDVRTLVEDTTKRTMPSPQREIMCRAKSQLVIPRHVVENIQISYNVDPKTSSLLAAPIAWE
jgi:hypothetical protein